MVEKAEREVNGEKSMVRRARMIAKERVKKGKGRGKKSAIMY